MEKEKGELVCEDKKNQSSRLINLAATSAIGFSALCTTLGITRDAKAFAFPEHAVITSKAVGLLLQKNYQNVDPILKDMEDYFHGLPLTPPIESLTKNTFEPEKFCFADITGLAGDHAPTPYAMLRRWFIKPSDATLSCTWQSVLDGLQDVNVSDKPPDECLERIENKPVNRKLFIKTLHNYYTLNGKLIKISDLNTEIAEADCAYVCLAKHGALHFRLSDRTNLQATTQIDKPNAAFSYAKWHGISLLLASRSIHFEDRKKKSLYRGLSLLYEMFALHYLQDGFAAGHIATPRGFGNMTTLATHDYYNAVGLPISVSKEFCRDLSFSNFPKLGAFCNASNIGYPLYIRGDNAMANGLVQSAFDVTFELPQLATSVSIQEVIDGMKENNKWPEDFANLADKTLVDFQKNEEENHCQADWECPDDKNNIAKLIRTIIDNGNMKALSLWPMATVPVDRVLITERLGGKHFYFSIITKNNFNSSNDARVGYGAGFSVHSLYKNKPFNLVAAALVEHNTHNDTFYGGFQLQLSAQWLRYPNISFLDGIGFTFTGSSQNWYLDPFASLFSFTSLSDKFEFKSSYLFGLSLTDSKPVGVWMGLSIEGIPSVRYFENDF